jgi:hypothetical protein
VPFLAALAETLSSQDVAKNGAWAYHTLEASRQIISAGVASLPRESRQRMAP